jgi:hypothetical protein
MIVYEIKDENGVTDKDRNLEVQHRIPLGTMVEVDLKECDEHGCRLFVVSHGRDCDGTPLYGLSFNPKAHNDVLEFSEQLSQLHSAEFPCPSMAALVRMSLHMARGSITSGLTEENLIVIK